MTDKEIQELKDKAEASLAPMKDATLRLLQRENERLKADVQKCAEIRFRERDEKNARIAEQDRSIAALGRANDEMREKLDNTTRILRDLLEDRPDRCPYRCGQGGIPCAWCEAEEFLKSCPEIGEQS